MKREQSGLGYLGDYFARARPGRGKRLARVKGLKPKGINQGPKEWKVLARIRYSAGDSVLLYFYVPVLYVSTQRFLCTYLPYSAQVSHEDTLPSRQPRK